VAEEVVGDRDAVAALRRGAQPKLLHQRRSALSRETSRERARKGHELWIEEGPRVLRIQRIRVHDVLVERAGEVVDAHVILRRERRQVRPDAHGCVRRRIANGVSHRPRPRASRQPRRGALCVVDLVGDVEGANRGVAGERARARVGEEGQ
jgi:hypothetical protein